jgi:hypothetical protein
VLRPQLRDWAALRCRPEATGARRCRAMISAGADFRKH